jgi:predicted transcriptional regulator
LSTGKNKIRIELEDADGGKYNLSLEGNLSKDKVQKVLQLVESLNISKHSDDATTKNNDTMESFSFKDEDKGIQGTGSIGSRIWNLIENNFAFSSFTSSNIAESFEMVYGEQLQLSLISTYLSRLSEKNKLIRSKRGKEWMYKLIRAQKSATTTLTNGSNSQSNHLLNSDSAFDMSQSDGYFLKPNALSTVYDLRL